MSRDSFILTRAAPETGVAFPVPKEKLDLVVLRSMAQKLLVTLCTLVYPLTEPLPLRYAFEGQHKRTHRMLLLCPDELLVESQLTFVGFVSNRRKLLDQRINDELLRVDQQMLGELMHIPGLLSYSSLELRAGNWYNLVILRESEARSHFKTLATHRYAAYQLAPAYYEWIRLHTGSLPGGLTRQEMVLHGTKFYHFPEGPQAPIVYKQEHVS